MSDDVTKRTQRTQRTQKGYDIPIPKRGEFMRNLKKAAKPSPPRRPKK